MPIQYQPVPEFQVPNLNLMGSYAQGVALAESQGIKSAKIYWRVLLLLKKHD